MHPVSKERVEWVKARLQLLYSMYAELRDRPAKYLVETGPAEQAVQHATMAAALQAIAAEQLQLRVEYEVLSSLYRSNNPGPY